MKYSKTNLIKLLLKSACAFLLFGPVRDAVGVGGDGLCQPAMGAFYCAWHSVSETTSMNTIKMDLSDKQERHTGNLFYAFLKNGGNKIPLNITVAPGASNENGNWQYNCESNGSVAKPCMHGQIRGNFGKNTQFDSSAQVTAKLLTIYGTEYNEPIYISVATDPGANGPVFLAEQHNKSDQNGYRLTPYTIKPLVPPVEQQIAKLEWIGGGSWRCSDCEEDQSFYFKEKNGSGQPGGPLYLTYYAPQGIRSKTFPIGKQAILEMTGWLKDSSVGNTVNFSANLYLSGLLEVKSTCYIKSAKTGTINFKAVDPRGSDGKVEQQAIPFHTVCSGFIGTLKQTVTVNIDKGNLDDDSRWAVIAKGKNSNDKGLGLVMSIPNSGDPVEMTKTDVDCVNLLNNFRGKFNTPQEFKSVMLSTGFQSVEYMDNIYLALCKKGTIGEYGDMTRKLTINSRWE